MGLRKNCSEVIPGLGVRIDPGLGAEGRPSACSVGQVGGDPREVGLRVLPCRAGQLPAQDLLLQMQTEPPHRGGYNGRTGQELAPKTRMVGQQRAKTRSGPKQQTSPPERPVEIEAAGEDNN